MDKSEKQAKKTLKKMKSTQKFIPIRDIADGMVITNDGRYIKIMEIIPVNFLMKSASEQNAIAKAFRNVFKAGPASMHIKAISRPANMSRHMKILKEEILNETSRKCTEMQFAYLRLLKNEASRNSVSRRYFIIFEYENDGSITHHAGRREIAQQLYTVAARISNCLRECGNEVAELNSQDEQIEEILYTLLNGEVAQKKPFEQYRQEVENRYLEYAGIPQERWGRTWLYIPPIDLIAPSRLDFPSFDYAVVNGRFTTYAYIPSDGYNPDVITGWLSPIINSYEGVDLDIYYNRIPREQIIFKIRQSLNQNRALIYDTSDTQASYENLQNSIKAAMHLLNGLASGEDFYYMAVMITVSAKTRKEMDFKFNELKKMLQTMDISIKKSKIEMRQSYMSALPFVQMDQNLWKKSKRNALTSGVASTYPFTSFEMMDENGILFGRNLTNNSLAIIDIFNTRVYKSCNVFLSGITGSGKTYSLLLLAIRMRIKRDISPVMIIAPEKEHEFERVAQAMDGQFIRFGSGSPHCINIMEIFRTDDTVTNILDGGQIISSRLAEKVQDLKTFFKLLIPDISYEEKELLDEALMVTYAQKGITEDNDSLIDPSDPEKFREMPILGDLYNNLLTVPKMVRVANIIKVLVSGSGKAFNGQTNVNLDNDFVVLGLEHLSDDLLPVGMYMAIDYAWSKIKEDRTKKKALMIDEWWRFAFDPLAAEYSLKIAKTIRAYGGSLIIATQQMTDVFAIDNGKYGEGVLNNCKIKILMQLEEKDAANVQRIMNLTDEDTARITRFKRGEALLIANSNSIPIKFESNRTENDLITTDRQALEKQAMAKMSENERRMYLSRRRKELGKILDSMELEDEGGDDYFDNEVGELLDIDEKLSDYFNNAETISDLSDLEDVLPDDNAKSQNEVFNSTDGMDKEHEKPYGEDEDIDRSPYASLDELEDITESELEEILK